MVRDMLVRLLRAALTVVLVVSFAFGILRLAGDPSQVVLGPNAPPEAVAAFRQAWGLDRPLSLQYVLYWYGILHGDFGNSMLDGPAVSGDRVVAHSCDARNHGASALAQHRDRHSRRRFRGSAA